MKCVVVHRGARDQYQAACALEEVGMLESLVTDLHWPADTRWARAIEGFLPARARQALRFRYSHVPRAQVSQCAGSGIAAVALSRAGRLPFGWKRFAIRQSDYRLGKAAGRLATEREAALLSYSYYGYTAFSNCGPAVPRILFQLHPHPLSVRRILLNELQLHPECRQSLEKEWELSLPEEDFARLVEETRMAQHWIVASSFTRSTLVEHGVPASNVHVVPYGVDLDRFRPAEIRRSAGHRRLRLLFVGTINQRKGIRYLLSALRSLRTKCVDLLVCGRVVDDLAVFADVPNVQIRPSVSNAELVQAYACSDLFVFPSVAEGFGHVLLESLASGVPILSTAQTAAPDLIAEGVEGFVVPAGSVDALTERIEWAASHLAELADMAGAARRRAERFTWEAFRSNLRLAIAEMVSPWPVVPEVASHV